MAIIWVVALVLFGLLEAATVNLVSVWFVGGSLAAFVASVCRGPLWLQILLFALVSGGLLACLRPLVKKKLNPKLIRTNVDGNLGKTAVVTEAIDNLAGQGQIKVDGMYWTARSENGEPIPKDSVVVIRKIEGVKALVVPAEEPVKA